MAGSGTRPLGAIALPCVMGLLLLLGGLLYGSAAGTGGEQARDAQETVSWDGWDSQLSTPPPRTQAGAVILWPAGDRTLPAHVVLLPGPGLRADALRDPQQLAHRIAGPRSPPLI
ncbi:hypothetical protein ACIBG7_16090 [Nonomuraea sp. NPDC050328]|uniref:hypothetical protein n=1 Tax=Nonomuraea sp. NPDC050328 TaxID=3364361 RepID=UPI003795F3FB